MMFHTPYRRDSYWYCRIQFGADDPQHVAPLIRRWLGLREHYGEV